MSHSTHSIFWQGYIGASAPGQRYYTVYYTHGVNGETIALAPVGLAHPVVIELH